MGWSGCFPDVPIYTTRSAAPKQGAGGVPRGREAQLCLPARSSRRSPPRPPRWRSRPDAAVASMLRRDVTDVVTIHPDAARAAAESPGARPPGKVIVVMPARNAALTLHQTVANIPREWVDEIIVVDDHSTDETVELARKLPLHLVWHPHNA